MSAVEIKPDVYWVGVNDRTTDLFEGIWPITDEGIVNNAYFIRDEKKAVIDTAKAFQAGDFIEKISQIAPPSEIDYVIVNHMEPDHSGVFERLYEIAPRAAFIGTRQTRDLLREFYGITDRVTVVSDGETLRLGKRALTFHVTPMVHWPETMMTREINDGILFSGDAFGGYGSVEKGIFDDLCPDIDFYLRESLRYFTNVIAKFSGMVKKAVDKIKGSDIGVVAPSHGLVWRAEPHRIIDLYEKWAGCGEGKLERGITVVHGTMYGNTDLMLGRVIDLFAGKGIPFESFDVSRDHISYILPSLWTKGGVVVSAPTYEAGLFPPMVYALDMTLRKGMEKRKVFRFGSYGWSGGGQREFAQIAERLKWEIVDSFEFRGRPTDEDIRACLSLAERFVESL
jgi:anaerobic nitric oxide reductase flavorubredoxin